MGARAAFIYLVEKDYCGRNGHLAVYGSRCGLKNKKDVHFLSGLIQRLAPVHKIDTRGRIPLSALVLWVLPSHLIEHEQYEIVFALII